VGTVPPVGTRYHVEQKILLIPTVNKLLSRPINEEKIQQDPKYQRKELSPTDAVWRTGDVYPGSRIRLFSIPDLGSEFFPSRIRIKELK
jgi:hypothetical protein